MTKNLDPARLLSQLGNTLQLGIVRGTEGPACLVQFADEHEPTLCRRLEGVKPAVGSEVLVATLPEGHGVVVGTLATGNEPILRLHSATEGEGTVVELPAGDCRLQSKDGTLTLESAASATALELGPRGARLQGATVTVNADTLRVEAREAEGQIQWLRTKISTVRQNLGLVETQAERIVLRTKSLYEEVEDLAQRRAQTLRLVAREWLQVFAQDVDIDAEEKVKLRGEKVYLG